MTRPRARHCDGPAWLQGAGCPSSYPQQPGPDRGRQGLASAEHQVWRHKTLACHVPKMPARCTQLGTGRVLGEAHGSKPQVSGPHVLTVPTPGPAFKDEPVGHGPVAPEVGQLPLAHDRWGDVPGQHENIIAEVKGGGAALQLGAWRHCHMKPMHWGQGRSKRASPLAEARLPLTPAQPVPSGS